MMQILSEWWARLNPNLWKFVGWAGALMFGARWFVHASLILPVPTVLVFR